MFATSWEELTYLVEFVVTLGESTPLWAHCALDPRSNPPPYTLTFSVVSTGALSGLAAVTVTVPLPPLDAATMLGRVVSGPLQAARPNARDAMATRSAFMDAPNL